MEGFFSRIFRSGVHPLEIGKRIQRVMEDGKTVALRRIYVPNVYRIELSRKDYERLAPLESKIVEELEIFVSEAARQREWVLADTPRVSFQVGDKVGAGEFRVLAEAVVMEAASSRRKAAKAVRATPKAGKAVIIMLDEQGHSIRTLTLDGLIVAGRQPDCDLVLPDQTVSRRHAEIGDQSGNGVYMVRDLESRNGTLVNGSEITEHRLQDGDRIAIGSTVMEFRRT